MLTFLRVRILLYGLLFAGFGMLLISKLAVADLINFWGIYSGTSLKFFEALYLRLMSSFLINKLDKCAIFVTQWKE